MATKTKMLALKVEPYVYESIKILADKQQRSMSNYIDMLLKKAISEGEQNGI